MPEHLCPNGHDSAELDFCSTCGVKLQEPAHASPFPGVGGRCPDCGSDREPGDSVFCEVCGFNFHTGAHGEVKPSAPPPAPLAAISSSPAPPPRLEWQVSIAVDPALRTPESPEPPADFDLQTVPLTKESCLIGRRSDRRAVFPDVSLDRDDAVSHRHALLNRMPDGTFVLRDIGSANGTRLNGIDLEPLTDQPVREGDQLTLGHWTRITIQAKS